MKVRLRVVSRPGRLTPTYLGSLSVAAARYLLAAGSHVVILTDDPDAPTLIQLVPSGAGVGAVKIREGSSTGKDYLIAGGDLRTLRMEPGDDVALVADGSSLVGTLPRLLP